MDTFIFKIICIQSVRLRNFTCLSTWGVCSCTLFSLILVSCVCKLACPHCYCTSQLLWKLAYSILGIQFGFFWQHCFQCLYFIFYEVPCRLFFMVKDIFIYIKKVIYYFWISTWSVGLSVPGWGTDVPGWATFLVLWSGRMPCFELRFFLIGSMKGVLVSLAEPATAEAAACYDHEIIFWELQDSLHQPHCSRKQSHANLVSPCCGAAFFPISCLFLRSEGCC